MLGCQVLACPSCCWRVPHEVQVFPVRPPCMCSGCLSPGPHGPGRCPSSLPRLTPAARRGHRTSFDVSVRTRALRGACSQRFVTVVDAVPRANVHRIRNCPRSTPCACPCVLSSGHRVRVPVPCGCCLCVCTHTRQGVLGAAAWGPVRPCGGHGGRPRLELSLTLPLSV